MWYIVKTRITNDPYKVSSFGFDVINSFNEEETPLGSSRSKELIANAVKMYGENLRILKQLDVDISINVDIQMTS